MHTDAKIIINVLQTNSVHELHQSLHIYNLFESSVHTGCAQSFYFSWRDSGNRALTLLYRPIAQNLNVNQ